jgi:hypothetical protein
MLTCRRFADILADACARLGVDMARCTFIAVDSHHLLLAGLPAHSHATLAQTAIGGRFRKLTFEVTGSACGPFETIDPQPIRVNRMA